MSILNSCFQNQCGQFCCGPKSDYQNWLAVFGNWRFFIGISIPDFSQKLDYQAVVNPFSKRQQLVRAMKPASLSERTCLPLLNIRRGVEALAVDHHSVSVSIHFISCLVLRV